MKLEFNDVLIIPKLSNITSRAQVELVSKFNFNNYQTWEGVPVVASNMDTVGTFEMATELSKHKLLTVIHKYYSVEDWVAFNKDNNLDYVAISTGIGNDDFKKLVAVLKACPTLKFICVDVANGYNTDFIKFVGYVRDSYWDKVIIAGNVVTPEGVVELAKSGADIIKIGIGPGKACTTRLKTGVGYPQLSAIMECSQVADEYGVYIMGDGGCRNPGDVAKAFGGGADFVMLGYMLAGHDESTSENVYEGFAEYKPFYGMSSQRAMIKHKGKVAEYRTDEGISMNIPNRGPVENTVKDILGGLRSTCTYVNAKNIRELGHNVDFVHVGR